MARERRLPQPLVVKLDARAAGTRRGRSFVARVMDFHALFDAQYVPVYRYLAHRLGDPAAAEDLAAETFLRAYAARASFRPGSPRAWLFTIATNLLRDHARGAGRRDAALAAWARAGAGGRRARVRAPRPAARARARRPARRGARGAAALRLGRALLRGDRHRHGRRRRHRPLPPRPRPRAARRRARPGEEPEMTVDDRLRAAHARIPEPDEATIARARARLDAAMGADPGAAAARRCPPSPRCGRCASRCRSPRSPLAALVACRRRAAPRRRAGAGAAGEPPAGGPVLYLRNTFHMSTRYIGANGRPTASPREAAYAISRSVPEEIWLAPDGSARVAYGKESAPYLPSPADERAWRAAGSPDLAKLMGLPGRWGPKRTNYGPGGFEAALLSTANLDVVLPEQGPAVRAPAQAVGAARVPDPGGAASSARTGPAQLRRDTFAIDALAFLQYPATPRDLRRALIAGAPERPRWPRSREHPRFRRPRGAGLPAPGRHGGRPGDRLRPRDLEACWPAGAGSGDAIRWNMTYRVEGRGRGEDRRPP